MKKFLAIVVLLLAIVLSVSVTVGAYIDESEAGLIYISINVNVDDGTVLIDDETLACEPPYYTESGHTMLPMSVIVDAFGAESVIEEDTITVTYLDTKMIYKINSALVKINDQSIMMPEKTILLDGTIMVPLRFFAESFGADVSYDIETHNITIRGQSDIMGNEVDFRLLLKYGNKDKVGNSKEKWRFIKPRDFDMEKNYYYGGYTFYVEDISFYLQVKKNTSNMTVDQLYLTLQDMTGLDQLSYWMPRGVLYEKHKGERLGLPYARLKVRHTDYLMEYHGFLTDDYVYIFTVEIPFDQFSIEKDNITINNILDSFETNYEGGDQDTVDVGSNTFDTKEKKEEYKDGNFAWIIKPLEHWIVDEYYGYYNKVSIYRESDLNDETIDYDDMMYNYDYEVSPYASSDKAPYVSDARVDISIYSNPSSQPISEWINGKMDYFKSEYNPNLTTVSQVTDTEINGNDAKKVTTEVNFGNYTRHSDWYFMYYENYRYMLVFDYDLRDAEQEGFLDTAQEILSSFTPANVDYEELGDVLEPDNYLVTDKITKQHTGEYCKLTLPYLWYAEEYYGDVLISDSEYSYYSSGQSLIISRDYLDRIDDEGNVSYYTLEEFSRKTFVNMRQSDPRNTTIVKALTKTEFKDREAYSYVISDSGNNVLRSWVEIIFVEGDDHTVFVISRTNNELYEGTRMDKIYDQVLDSIEFIN